MSAPGGDLHPELLEVANAEGVTLVIDDDDTIQIQADSVEHAASTAVEFAWLAAKALDERDELERRAWEQDLVIRDTPA